MAIIPTGARALKVSLIGFAAISLGLPLIVFASMTYDQGTYDSGTYAGSGPAVTTGSSSAITQTSGTLGGSISSIGSTSPSVEGFVYGATIAYGATTTEPGGPFSAGAFSEPI